MTPRRALALAVTAALIGLAVEGTASPAGAQGGGRTPAGASARIRGAVENACSPDPSGITVYLVGRSVVAITGGDGAFDLGPVPPGSYTVRARIGPLLSAEVPASLASGQTLEVGLLLVGDAGACHPQAVCGNNLVEGAEVCDGTDLRGLSCAAIGLGPGALDCHPSCTAFDTSHCGAVNPLCGNGVLEGAEECDQADLGGATCQSLGFASGTPACAVGCTFDTSGCVPAAVCGNGVIEGAEACDGQNLGGQSCETLGFASGQLACASCDFDAGACVCDDGNECTIDANSSGACTFQPAPQGQPCNAGAGTCNDVGECVPL